MGVFVLPHPRYTTCTHTSLYRSISTGSVNTVRPWVGSWAQNTPTWDTKSKEHVLPSFPVFWSFSPWYPVPAARTYAIDAIPCFSPYVFSSSLCPHSVPVARRWSRLAVRLYNIWTSQSFLCNLSIRSITLRRGRLAMSGSFRTFRPMSYLLIQHRRYKSRYVALESRNYFI